MCVTFLSGNLMIGRRFAFANPTSAPISVQIYAFSDKDSTRVQVTDNGGTRTDSQVIVEVGEGN